MAARIDLTLDCADAKLLADFWKTALGYMDEPPPAPFKTRAEWLAQFEPPEDDSVDDAAWLWARIRAESERLVTAGGTVQEESPGTTS